MLNLRPSGWKNGEGFKIRKRKGKLRSTLSSRNAAIYIWQGERCLKSHSEERGSLQKWKISLVMYNSAITRLMDNFSLN